MRVTDTGQGISVELLPRVFERFEQAESARTRVDGGLGLGLTIVRELVKAHGGTVVAESDGEEKGSTFTLTLPVSGTQAPIADSPVDRGDRNCHHQRCRTPMQPRSLMLGYERGQAYRAAVAAGAITRNNGRPFTFSSGRYTPCVRGSTAIVCAAT